MTSKIYVPGNRAVPEISPVAVSKANPVSSALKKSRRRKERQYQHFSSVTSQLKVVFASCLCYLLEDNKLSGVNKRKETRMGTRALGYQIGVHAGICA